MLRPSSLLPATLALAFSCGVLDPSPSEDGPGGKADNPVDAEFGLDERPNNQTCLAPPRPPSGSNVSMASAFSALSFTLPIAMMQAPADGDDWYVVEKRGTVWRFPNQDNVSAQDATLFADIRSVVDSTPNEAGLLGMAFAPDFAQSGTVYLSYTRRAQGRLFSVVSEFASASGELDAASERIVLFVEQPFANHNGGGIAFGPDGFLYIGFGDGGSANDPQGNGQNKNTRLGTLLRIDPRETAGGAPFSTPTSNPFASGGGLAEIFAYGLRNPWRFSFDTATGELWLADVGQDEFEEINKITGGGNYGWNLKEANECFSVPAPCDDPTLIDPVAAYDHSQNDRSITGGFVYRGSDIPSLVGSYVYGDFVSGRVWGLFPDTDGGLQPQLLFESGINITSFAQGIDGEMYMLSFGDGSISRLVAAGQQTDNFPQLLSETGCFQPGDPTLPTEAMIPYGVNMALWSDGADKERFMAVPNGEEISVAANGDFDFPVGSILTKTFYVGATRAETRLMVRHSDGGWAGYTYEWDEDQTDATLLAAGKVANIGGQSWTIPSRSDCLACHTAAAGRVLGPTVAQLNGKQTYASTNRSANQLKTLAHVGLIAGVNDVDPEALPAFPRLADTTASVTDRARAYLDSNCAHCHQPGGPGRSDSDMRATTTLRDSNMCDALPEAGDLGIAGARLIAPGDAARSVVLERMRSTTPIERMPALGTARVHSSGVGVVEAWIDSLAGCQ